MDLLRSREQLERAHDVAKFEFIATELDIAITFCEMAIAAEDQNKAERSAKHARQAYEVAKRFLPKARLEPLMNQEIDEKLQRLEPLLQQLGDGHE